MAVPRLSHLLDEVIHIFSEPLSENVRMLRGPSGLAGRILSGAEAAKDAWDGAGEDGAGEDVRAGVLRRMVDLGALLADMQPATFEAVSPGAASSWLHLAAATIAACSCLMSLVGWAGSSADLFRWARCGGLMLTCSPIVVLRLLQCASPGGAGSLLLTPSMALACSLELAESQLYGLHELVLLLDEPGAERQRTLAAWVGSVGRGLVGWLAALAAAISKAPESSDTGTSSADALHKFAIVATHVLTSPAFARHQAALQAAPQLQARLCTLLLPMCRAACREMQQHSHGGASSSSSTDSWQPELALKLFALLPVPCLQQGVQGQLQGSSGLQLVQTVAALVGGISYHPPSGEAHLTLLSAAVCAWGHICRTVSCLEPHTEVHRAAVQDAVLLLQALAHVGEQLQEAEAATEEAEFSPVVSLFLENLGHAAALAGKVLQQQREAGSAADPGAARAYVVGAVQAARAAAQLSTAQPYATLPTLFSLCSTASVLCSASKGQLLVEEAQRAELADRMRAVHAAMCRLAHSGATSGTAADQTYRSAVLKVMVRSFVCWLALEGLEGCLDEAHKPATAPKQHACIAAHVCAVGRVLGHCSGDAGAGGPELHTQRTDSTTAMLMVTCLSLCGQQSRWLCGSEHQGAVVAAVRAGMRTLQAAPEGFRSSLPSATHFVNSIMAQSVCNSQLAVLLVGSGLLGEMVAACLGAMPHPQQVTDLHTKLHGLLTGLARAVEEAAADSGSSPAAQVPPDVLAAAAQLGAAPSLLPAAQNAACMAVQAAFIDRLLPLAMQLAAGLEAHWQQPEQRAAAALELAQAAATRGCANLRCANLGAQGGPDCGQVAGSKRCSGCRAVRYCCTACQTEDWRVGGHRKVCAALAALRAAEAEEGAAQ